MDIPAPTVDPKALDILMNYKWPGNVRELRNVVQRLVLNNADHIGVKEVSNPMILKNSPLSKDSSFEELYTGQVLTLREMEKSFRLRYFKYVRQTRYCTVKFLSYVQRTWIEIIIRTVTWLRRESDHRGTICHV